MARQRQGAEMTKLDSAETKTAFATRVGLTKGRISQLVAEGLPVRADGRIDVAVGLTWIEDNLDPARRNKGGATSAPARVSTTLAEAKRLHEIVKVQRAKLAFEKEQGLLVETAAATRTVFARARAERDAHMAWVQRTAPLLAAEVGADTCSHQRPRSMFHSIRRSRSRTECIRISADIAGAGNHANTSLALRMFLPSMAPRMARNSSAHRLSTACPA